MVGVVIVAAAAVCAQIVTTAAVILLLRSWIHRKETELREAVSTFVTSPGKDQPSPLAEAVQSCGQILGAEICKQLQSRILGGEGAVKRQLKGIAEDLAGDQLAGETPLAQGLLDAFPSVGARAKRSPVAAMILQAVLSRVMGNQGGGSAPGSGGSRGSGNGSSQLQLPF